MVTEVVADIAVLRMAGAAGCQWVGLPALPKGEMAEQAVAVFRDGRRVVGAVLDLKGMAIPGARPFAQGQVEGRVLGSNCRSCQLCRN
jgi:hypothetical protein